jgi:S1-C subfamily serine protease
MRGPDIGIWFSRSSRDGLVISDVSSRGPIAKLGFREGDRIVSVNGHRVTREDDFIRYLLHSDSRRVTVIVLRDNREETIYVEPVVLTNEYESADVDPLERFGLIVDDRYDDRIVVWRVISRSPAYYAGFRPGDVIVKFGDHPYRTRTEFERGSRDWKSGDVNVQIRRGDRTRDMSVEIPNSARSDQRTGDRSVVREERTAQHDSDTSDQRTTDQADRSTDKNQSTNNSQRDNNNRGGVLNNLRGRGSR